MNNCFSKKDYNRLLMLVVLFLINLGVYAQGNLVDIRGQVVDATSQEPLIGVTAKEVGSNSGSVTDLDGNYSLKVKSGATIEFSYVGYKTVTYKSGNYLRPYQVAKSGLYYNGLYFCQSYYLSPIAVSHFLISAEDGATISTSPIYQNPGWTTTANEPATDNN